MFFKKKNTTTINDDLFGKLSFIEESIDENHWNGAVEFENENIEILIYCKTSSLDNYQKKMFIELKNRYQEIKPAIEGFINKTLSEKNINARNYSIGDDFNISHISIFASDNQKIEIAYNLNNDFCLFEVVLENFIPVDLGISA